MKHNLLGPQLKKYFEDKSHKDDWVLLKVSEIQALMAIVRSDTARLGVLRKLRGKGWKKIYKGLKDM